jgi:3-oxoacyl-[acyl-carrier-protein] synthase II
VPIENPERVGVIFATAFGPHNTTFSFLDEILAYGDAAVSPTVFSNSVHNAAVSYISNTLKIKGPTWTITCFKNPFQQALQLAQIWLAEGRCDQVLAGAGDECGTVLNYICSQKLKIAESSDQMRPFFDPAGPAVIPGELAVFFLLSRDTTGGIQMELQTESSPPPDLLLVDFESRELDMRAGRVPAGCWSHRAGATPVSQAFTCAVAGLMLKKKNIYCAADMLNGRYGTDRDFSGGFPLRMKCGGRIYMQIKGKEKR